jgi:hypothetical protein
VAVAEPVSGSRGVDPATPDIAAAVANAHRFFEEHSGWAPPDDETLADWVADGVCRCPDECLVAPDAWCEHGLASWWLVLAALGDVEVPPVPPGGPPPEPEPEPRRG